MTSPIDLAKLPPLRLTEELGFEDIQDQIKADILALQPELEPALALDSDPLTKLIQVFAYREQALRSEYNLSVQAVTLAFAAGGDLDHIASRVPLTRHDGESDDAFRSRIQLAPEGLSVAGPVQAYRSHILNADQRVQDVRVSSPAPGEVLCHVLFLQNAFDPEYDQDEQAGVALNLIEAVIDDGVRPLTDRVVFEEANIEPYNVEAALEFGNGPDSVVVMAAAENRLRDYLNQRRRFDGRIPRTAIIAALHAPGVESVNLIQPAADIVPQTGHVPELNDLTLTEIAGA